MTESVESSWARIVGWLTDHVPQAISAFQKPTSSDELDAAAEALGIELPDDFRRLYQLNNGVDPDGEAIGLFPSEDEWDEMAFVPCALEQIVGDWEIQKDLLEDGSFADSEPESCDDGVKNEWWNLGWVPFAWDGGGDYYCIDLAPTAGGTAGQVITHNHETGEHRILATSLSAYLSQLADGLEAGLYEYSDDGLRRIEAGR